MYLKFFLDLEAGNSDLDKAVTKGQEATALSLWNQGADFTTQNSRGETPFHIAFHKNLPRVVEKILTNYKNFVNNVTDNNGLSCLHIASSFRGKIGIAPVEFSAAAMETPALLYSSALTWRPQAAATLTTALSFFSRRFSSVQPLLRITSCILLFVSFQVFNSHLEVCQSGSFSFNQLGDLSYSLDDMDSDENDFNKNIIDLEADHNDDVFKEPKDAKDFAGQTWPKEQNGVKKEQIDEHYRKMDIPLSWRHSIEQSMNASTENMG
ncbi:hypothetical protein QAD02_013559 [Eretmocerus hayati]|uniref:Uncharacterized protein n=1 Tax=Eretmocerus hayati TaxID=131215 RepID=A0ACC2P5R1_9HYME|nr:hypothetical protein QAD02_013559 [Eretmocerus hayati]